MSDRPETPERDPLRPHSFDGIQEYDNQLPRWWLGTFYFTIVVAILYVGYFHFGPGELGVERMLTERRAAIAEQAANAKGLPPEQLLREFLADPVRVARGQALFQSKGCVACHGPELLGAQGPNLRDDRWKYGNTLTDIYTTLEKGRVDAENNSIMPPIGQTSTQEERIDLALYIVTQNKNHKANGQGHQVPGEVEDPIDY